MAIVSVARVSPVIRSVLSSPSLVVLPRMVPRRVKAEETVNSTLTAIRTAANVSLVHCRETEEAEAYISSTIQLLSNAVEWCATDSSSSPDVYKVRMGYDGNSGRY